MKIILSVCILMMVAVGTIEANSKEARRRYLVPESLASYLPGNVQSLTKGKSGDQLLVSLSEEQMESFSQKIHKEKHTCGGFIDVEEEILAGDSLLNLVQALHGKGAREVFDNDDLSSRPPQFPVSVGAALSKVQKSRYEAELKGLVAFPDRSSKTVNGQKAADWITRRWQEIAQNYSEREISYSQIETGSRYKQSSVLVRIHGKNSSKGAVVIGAHMDTYPRNKPGADDDASGVAAVIESFNAILQSEVEYDRDIYFIAYAAEEVGLVGSNQVATYFKKNNINVRAVLQLDMIGYRPANDRYDIYFVTDFVDRDLTLFSKRVVTKYVGIPDNKIGEFKCGYACSDHASWTRKGFKSASPFETHKQKMNDSIHTGRDTIGKLNIDHAMKYVKLSVAFLIELAEPLSLM